MDGTSAVPGSLGGECLYGNSCLAVLGRGGLGAMPLSEHEQRVLRQIERQFEGEGLPHRRLLVLGQPTDARQAARKVRRAVAGLFVGLVALSLSFAFSWIVGLIGFVIMLASAVTLVQSLRWLGRARWGQLVSGFGGGRGRVRQHDPEQGVWERLYRGFRRGRGGGVGGEL